METWRHDFCLRTVFTIGGDDCAVCEITAEVNFMPVTRFIRPDEDKRCRAHGEQQDNDADDSHGLAKRLDSALIREIRGRYELRTDQRRARALCPGPGTSSGAACGAGIAVAARSKPSRSRPSCTKRTVRAS